MNPALILLTPAQFGGPHGPSDLPAGASVERSEELWALRPAPATTFFGMRCFDAYPSSFEFMAALGMAKPLTDPAWYQEDGPYGEADFAAQHATPNTWAPVTRDLIESGLELMITPDAALSSALEGQFLSNGMGLCEVLQRLV